MQEFLRRVRFGIKKNNKYLETLHRLFKAATLICANVVMWSGKTEEATLWFVVFLVLCKFDSKE